MAGRGERVIRTIHVRPVPGRLSSLEFRRHLRRTSTDAERLLWKHLRARRLGVKFRRQVSVGPYTLDFFSPERRIAVELDGGQHYEAGVRDRDEVRDAFLASRDIRVVRFSDREMLLEHEAVLQVIWQATRGE